MAPDCSHNITGLAYVAIQEYLVTYCLTFVFFILCVVPFRVHFIDILRKLLRPDIFFDIFAQTFCVWNIICGLCRTAHDCGHLQAPAQKLPKEKCTQDQQPLQLQSAPPPKDEYLEENQPGQTLTVQDDSSLLAPLTIDEPEYKETFTPTERLESIAKVIPEADTLVSQVTPLLGTTPRENTQLQH